MTMLCPPGHIARRDICRVPPDGCDGRACVCMVEEVGRVERIHPLAASLDIRLEDAVLVFLASYPALRRNHWLPLA